MPDGFPDVGIWQSRHSLRVLDVSGWSTDNGAPVIQWDMHGGNNQQFQIESLGGGQFALRSVHSGKVLDVAGASLDNGAPILQWDWHGGNNQRFWIADAEGDLFSIRSVHSGKVLDVSGWSTDNGAAIQQWDWHGGNNQLWQIVMPSSRPAQRPGGGVRFDDEPQPIVADDLRVVQGVGPVGVGSAGAVDAIQVGGETPGTLYRTQQRMEREGYIGSEQVTPEAGPTRRKYYDAPVKQWLRAVPNPE